MGQYYRCIFLTENNKPLASVSSYDFGSGAKLMEHSWMKNPFVRFVERQLMVEPQKVVWGGDYADQEDPTTLSPMEIKLLADDDSEYTNTEKIKENGANLYDLSDLVGKLTHDENNNYTSVAPLKVKYLINHDKKQFVDKSKSPKDSDGWQIHPLPLLTCEGNLRGGGDYHSENGQDFIGIWARDKISVATKKSNIPKDYVEIVPNFNE